MASGLETLVPNGSPGIFSNPMQDQMAALAAQTAARIAGYENPKFTPQLRNGMQPFEAAYSINIAEESLKRSQNALSAHAAIALGGQLQPIVDRLSPQLGATFAQLQQNGAFGAVAGALFSNQSVQSILGGNIMSANDTLFANRFNMSMVGNRGYLSPLDAQGQALSLSQQTEFSKALFTSMQTPGFGNGFKMEGMADLSVYLAERGVGGMNELGRPGKLAAMAQNKAAIAGQWAGPMSELSNIMGTRDMGTLTEAMDKITGGDLTKVDPARLQDSLSKLTAISRIIGRSSQDILDAAASVSAGVGASLGATTGGYAAVSTGLDLTSQATGLRIASGNRISLEQAIGTVGGMAAVGLSSGLGKDAVTIGWMSQQGLIKPEQWMEYNAAMQMGSTRDATAAANRIFEDFAPTAAAGRAIFQNPANLRRMAEESNTATATYTQAAVMQAMGNEVNQRQTEALLGLGSGMIGRIGRETGFKMEAVTGMSEARVSGMRAVLQNYAAADTDGKGGFGGMMEAFDAVTQGKTGRAQLNAAINLISRSPAFESIRDQVVTGGRISAQATVGDTLSKNMDSIIFATEVRADTRGLMSMAVTGMSDTQAASARTDLMAMEDVARKAQNASGDALTGLQNQYQRMRSSFVSTYNVNPAVAALSSSDAGVAGQRVEARVNNIGGTGLYAAALDVARGNHRTGTDVMNEFSAVGNALNGAIRNGKMNTDEFGQFNSVIDQSADLPANTRRTLKNQAQALYDAGKTGDNAAQSTAIEALRGSSEKFGNAIHSGQTSQAMLSRITGMAKDIDAVQGSQGQVYGLEAQAAALSAATRVFNGTAGAQGAYDAPIRKLIAAAGSGAGAYQLLTAAGISGEQADRAIRSSQIHEARDKKFEKLATGNLDLRSIRQDLMKSPEGKKMAEEFAGFAKDRFEGDITLEERAETILNDKQLRNEFFYDEKRGEERRALFTKSAMATGARGGSSGTGGDMNISGQLRIVDSRTNAVIGVGTLENAKGN